MREVHVIRSGAFAAVVVLALIAPAPAGGEEGAPAPRLVPATTEIDAGTVVRGTLVEAVFELRNEGTADLRILSAKPG